MDDNYGELVESMGVVSRKWVWLVSVVVRTGGILIYITYPYSSSICSFLQQHPYILFIFKFFSFFRKLGLTLYRALMVSPSSRSSSFIYN